jgi:cytoskeletal protein CcmA (bactofilin family)
MTNDLPAGTIVGAMTFNTAYILNGNPLTLTGDVSTNNVLNCNVDLKLGSSLHLPTATYYGAIDVNGQTLTINGSAQLNGALNGSGAIVTSGSVRIQNGGTFSGTLNAADVDVQGVMPGANITATLSGNGTVGTVSGRVSPGVGLYDPHTVDYLHTKTLTTNGLGIDLNAGGISDKVLVTGTVTVGGPLQLSVINGSPSGGQTFTIIDNDGADSVSGTFTGLSEGAIVAAGPYQFHISYTGGDGNDVVLTALSGIKTWTGAVNSNWSNSQNWSPQGAPSSGEALLFPAGPPTTMTNDLPAGTTVGAVTFSTAYTLNGNPLTLTGDVTTNNVLNCNVDLKLGSSLHLPTATYYGAIDVNGQTLSISGSPELNGALNGSGAVVITGSVRIQNGGTFSGTLNAAAVDVQGVIPGANITTFQMSGNGTVGTVNGGISPGVGLNNPHTIDYLHTKTLTASGLGIDLNADGISDKVLVTGTVTLSGSLQLSFINGSPTGGQTFTIIDNDGTDPVNGTFTSLPEGAIVTSGPYQFHISYAGSDGNDVVLTALAGVKTWTGAVNGNWSNPQNWSPQGVPSSGEALLFPAGPPTTMTNDLPAGTTVGAMTFNTSYTLNGNPLTLVGDLSTNNVLNCNVDLKLGSSLHLAYATYNGAIDVNGQTLTIAGNLNGAVNGTGAILCNGSLQVTNGGTFTGTLNATMFEVQGVMPGANITTAQLSGNGTVGTVNGGSISPGVGLNHSVDYLHTKTLTASGMNIDLNAEGISDKILVTGTVTLSGSLQLSVVNGSPAGGQTFTIIDNDGTDPVSGAFTGLPEGQIVVSGPYRFRISYAGGDANDVVLATLIDTTVGMTQTSVTTIFGEPMTLTATVTAPSGTPTGSVTFSSDGAAIGTAPLQNGIANLTVTTLTVGTHTIVATFLGSGAFANSVSASISHVITRGSSRSTIVADHPSIRYGQTARFTVTMSAQAPAAGQPTGIATIAADGVSLGTAPIVNGVATFETTAFHPGVKSVTATYGGDANFEGSTALPVQQYVGQAQTQVNAQSPSAIIVGEWPRIAVLVSVTPGSALVPMGAVSVSEGGVVLGTQALDSGTTNLTLGPLLAGDHTLVVSYGGDADFEASSATIIQSVIGPTVSLHGTRVIEGNRGTTTVSLVVGLSMRISEKVRVSFSTIAGSATQGVDYEGTSGVIEFAPGELTRSIELHILGDTLPENDETFSVLLSDPVNATIETPSVVVVIDNDDQMPARRRPSGR